MCKAFVAKRYRTGFLSRHFQSALKEAAVINPAQNWRLRLTKSDAVREFDIPDELIAPARVAVVEKFWPEWQSEALHALVRPVGRCVNDWAMRVAPAIFFWSAFSAWLVLATIFGDLAINLSTISLGAVGIGFWASALGLWLLPLLLVWVFLNQHRQYAASQTLATFFSEHQSDFNQAILARADHWISREEAANSVVTLTPNPSTLQ